MPNPIPAGYRTVTPYLILKGASAAIEFYRRAFDAEEVLRLSTPDGGVAHAEIKIGDSMLMCADEFPDMGFHSPKKYGGTPVGFAIYVPDVDAAFAKAVAAGAAVKRPVQDQFYGDRTGQVEDPFGHSWTLATHIEDVSPEEMRRRMAAMG
jgi:PhnB protein